MAAGNRLSDRLFGPDGELELTAATARQGDRALLAEQPYRSGSEIIF